MAPKLQGDHLNGRMLANKLLRARAGEAPYTLLLGAGASVSSGIPTAKGLIKEWHRELCRNLLSLGSTPTEEELRCFLVSNEYETWRGHPDRAEESDYGALFGYFHQKRAERQMFIEDQLEGRKPTFGYLYLAGLIAKEHFNRILTTNFDDLLADALFRFYDVKPIVCAFDSAMSSIRKDSRRPKIIKLHGDYLFDDFRNMRSELQRLPANMEDKLREMCEGRGLIVVGYSGSDQTIMGPLQEMLRSDRYLNMGVHWCVHEAAPDPPEEVTDLLRHYRNKLFVYRIKGFDELMEELFLACRCSLPPILESPETTSIFNEFYNAVEIGMATRKTPMMINHLQVFKEKDQNRQSNRGILVIEAELAYQEGNRFVEVGDFDAARPFLENSRDSLDEYFAGALGPFELQARAWKRRSGLHLALARVDHAQQRDTRQHHLNRAFEAVAKGNEMCQQREGEKLDRKLRRSFYYNGCCAWGVKCLFSGELSADDLANAKLCLANMLALDWEGEDLLELRSDSDFSPLRYLIEEAFPINQVVA